MKTKNQDQLIYDKSRTKVIRRNIIAYILMCIFFTSIYIVFQFNFLTSSLSNFKTVYLGCAISQLCLFGMMFLLLSFGKKFFRTLYWLAYLYSLLLLYVPIQFLLKDYFHLVTYLIWILSSIIFLFATRKYGKSLKTNRWCKIYFDLELEVEEGETEEQIEEIYLSDKKFYDEDDEDEEEEQEVRKKVKRPLELPNISLRVGICVYASLMIFPIFMQIFSDFFASKDLQTVFATKDIFVFCIFSALIWTLPVFFYYYSHPKSKLITMGCIFAEGIRILFYSRSILNYWNSNEYPVRVFILFILVEVIRYAILFYAIFPIFKMEMPEEEQEDDDEYA